MYKPQNKPFRLQAWVLWLEYNAACAHFNFTFTMKPKPRPLSPTEDRVSVDSQRCEFASDEDAQALVDFMCEVSNLIMLLICGTCSEHMFFYAAADYDYDIKTLRHKMAPDL